MIPREPARVEYAAPAPQARAIRCDLCVVGAGAAGVSAAVEAARLGLEVCLVDGLPQVGGQSVNGLIGTLCGFYSRDEPPCQLQYGFAGEVLAELQAAGALAFRRGRGTLIALYDEQQLAARYAAHLLRHQVQVVLGALVVQVERSGRRIQGVQLQTRYGGLHVRATTYVDATGDAALAAAAGLPLQCANVPVYGTSMFSLTGLGPQLPPREAIEHRLQQVADRYGLARRDGFVFAFPGRDLCLVNLMHYQTPLDALAMSATSLRAWAQVEQLLAFLRGEFPAAFGNARLLSLGQPGVRQTRGIVGRAPLTTAQVRSGERPRDAIARSGWPIEFHGEVAGVHWEDLPPGHLAWVPLSAMLARDADNLLAAGRCIDAEPLALSAVRVIGPCMAMGAAAAAAAQVGHGSLQALDVARVQQLVADNLARRDPAPLPAANVSSTLKDD